MNLFASPGIIVSRKAVVPISHHHAFEILVQTHTQKLYQFVRTYVKSHTMAEDVVQETFLLAYKNYAAYQETGKGLPWLKTIAKNIIYRQHHKTSQLTTISICQSLQPAIHAIPCTQSLPEDQLVNNERMAHIMALIHRLPPQQRMAVTYRHIHQLSIAETSAKMNIPQATVKSNTSYGLQSIRKWMGVRKTTKKGAIHMSSLCKDLYGHLLEYAKGYLSPDLRQAIEAHGKTCPKCQQMITGLTALWPYLQQEFIADGYMNYFTIEFPAGDNEGNLSYTGMNFEFTPKYVAELNQYLAENNNTLPPGENVIESGHDADALHLSEYAMDGQAVAFETVNMSPDYSETHRKTFPKLHTNQWTYSVFLRPHYSKHVQSKEAPNLYRVNCSNHLGQAAKSGIFAWVPAGATNVRIQRGTGILTLDGCQFAYTTQFATGDDSVDLAFSYNK